MSAVIGDVVSTFFISEKFTSTSRYQILDRNETGRKSSKKEYASNYIKLFTCDEFMNIFEKNCSLDYSASQLSKMTKIKAIRKSCWFDVSITSGSKSDSYILQQAFEYSTKHYAEVINYDLALVNPAKIPSKPSSPNIPFNTFVAAFIGFTAGCIALMIIPKQRILLENEEEVKNITKIPVIAKIPFVTSRLGTVIRIDQSRNVFFKRAFSELMPHINNISDDPCSVITVCSPSKGDGKTTVAINMAISAAMNNKCVLILDSNFRNSTFRRYYNIEDDEPGFADIISGRAKIKEALKTTDHSSLFILPSGTAGLNPAGMLLLSKTKNIISKLKPMFDLIIIDTPAVNDYSDVMTLKEITNAFILTIDSETTNDEDLKRALKSFELSEIYVKGIVLNKMPVRTAAEESKKILIKSPVEAPVQQKKSKNKRKNEFINMKF